MFSNTFGKLTIAVLLIIGVGFYFDSFFKSTGNREPEKTIACWQLYEKKKDSVLSSGITLSSGKIHTVLFNDTLNTCLVLSTDYDEFKQYKVEVVNLINEEPLLVYGSWPSDTAECKGEYQHLEYTKKSRMLIEEEECSPDGNPILFTEMSKLVRQLQFRGLGYLLRDS